MESTFWAAVWIWFTQIFDGMTILMAQRTGAAVVNVSINLRLQSNWDLRFALDNTISLAGGQDAVVRGLTLAHI